MPHITIPTFKHGHIRELDTDGGWMKLVRKGGGLYHYFFDSNDSSHSAKMENLRLWFLGHKGTNLREAVPELTQVERKMILEGIDAAEPDNPPTE